MEFFRAYKANSIKTSTYFIESTAPDNVDDETPPSNLPEKYRPYLSAVDSDQAVKEIAGILARGKNPNLVVMSHGFNNPQADVLRMYMSAALAIDADPHINGRDGLVCVGYRWPSEKMGAPSVGAREALPTLASWILTFGILIVLVSLPLYFIPGTKGWMFNWLGRFGEHVFTLIGWTAAGLMLMAILLRIIVYFRDNYRATNYGIPDLIQVIRAIDAEIMRQREASGATDAARIQLSFIGHSMGGFVVTNAIRTLSDVFAVRVDALNSYGAGSTPDPDPAAQPSRAIGEAFELKRFVLASPDIPAETLLTTRGNFLASALSRFDEAYLFSNEGDEVLRQISTLANYFVFPAKGRDHGFRLGNVEVLSRQFGMIDVSEKDFLRVLRIGNLTLQQLYDALEDARESRIGNGAETPEQAPLPKRFTYLDCTDYIDREDPAKPDERKNWKALLTFAKCRKRNDPEAKLRWYSHLHLLLAYIVRGQKPNVHGGYFEGVLSQQLIYRLACLGYGGTVAAYGSEAVLGQACEQKQIRMLVSPLLWSKRHSVKPPAPTGDTMRTFRKMAPGPEPAPAQPPQPSAPTLPLEVPNLVGMPIVQARATVERLREDLLSRTPAGQASASQLLLLEITMPAEGQPTGSVISQTPAPGGALAPRTTIEVVIAK
jgi:pimeloyl-ACP methyl ester carboxylesterase